MTDFQGKHTVVIGGGFAGMAAALLLARHGCAVTVVEKKRVLGATLRGFSRQGVHFDTGLHYAGGLAQGGALWRYFRLLGLDGLPLTDFNADCFDRVRFPSPGGGCREIRLPIGAEAMGDALAAEFPNEAPFIRDYLHRLREAFFSSSFLNFGDLRSHMDDALHAESLDAVLRRGTADPLLRTVLSFHAMLYGVPPAETPFLQHARVAGSYLEGVKTVRGGGQALVQALEARLAEEKVSAACGVAVKTLRFSSAGSGGPVSGVTLADGTTIPADGVVYTAHPALLPAMIPGGIIKPAFLSRLRALEDTLSTCTLFCISAAPVPVLRGSNLFVCSEDGFERGFLPDRAPADGPFYITGNTGTDDGGIEGMGGQGLTIFAPGTFSRFAAWADTSSGRRPEAYRRYKEAMMDSVWEAVSRACPELCGARVVDGGTPLTNRDFLDSPGGGLYGARHSLRQFNPLPMTRVPNLWIAGQSVVAPGLLGAVISAVVACGCIFGMETMHREVAACA